MCSWCYFCSKNIIQVQVVALLEMSWEITVKQTFLPVFHPFFFICTEQFYKTLLPSQFFNRRYTSVGIMATLLKSLSISS